VPMREAYAQAAVRDHFGEGEVGGLDVEVALDDLQVRRDAAEELVRLLVGDVAEAEDLADLPWGEELLELWAELSAWGRARGVGLQAVTHLCGYVLCIR
jgi:hypothetical protein